LEELVRQMPAVLLSEAWLVSYQLVVPGEGKVLEAQ
jgi:hypothetical protein